MPQFSAVIELSDLDGTNGFTFTGAPFFSHSGYRVASAGDINGDGFDDMMVGAPSYGDHSIAGHAYIVFGGRGAFDAQFDLSSLDGHNGFAFTGQTNEQNGKAVSSIGDINGDGFDDVIVGGAIAYDGFSSVAYIIYGKSAFPSGEIHPSDLLGGGCVIHASQSRFITGDAVAAAGDVNGDGFDDFVIGSYTDQISGTSPVFVVFGKPDFGFSFNLGILDGNNGFRVDAPVNSHVYSSVSAGDLNGDGFTDVIIGTNQFSEHPTPGHAYVVYGKADGFDATLDLASLDGNNGFSIVGVNNYDYAGIAVSLAGDINGDGLADLVVGARGSDDHGSNSGATYVMFGTTDAFGASLALSSIDGNNGFKILGVLAGDGVGRSVDLAGDVNGDGFDDLIIGASGVDTNGSAAGAAYVLFGKETGFGGTIELTDLDGNNGFTINGVAAGNVAGRSVASAGDINGDGFDDLIVGAPLTDPSDQGESYVIFGVAPDTAVHRVGTVASQTLAGGDFSDKLQGLGGDDELFGNGGKDNLKGGAGDDVLYGGRGADNLDGGGDSDTFVYFGAIESTHAKFDTVVHFDFGNMDRFDLASNVTGIDATVSGPLSKASFDADLAAAADASHLEAEHAVLVTVDGGDFDGKTFLIIDYNHTAGYQAGKDIVVRLDDAKHLSAIDMSDFI